MRYPVKLLTVNSGYQIESPDVAGCRVNAESVDEGLRKFETSLKEHFALLAEYGENIPQASDIQSHVNITEDQNVIWAFIEIDITPFLGKSQKINVTLPELLIRKIDNAVGQNLEYKSRSGFIAQACLNELNNLK